ncbi:MAG: hypothetical protein PUB13_06365 [Lachnospiraceae bacterium]|nr:hypothetical protein [Lachnospiraceae bacterium]
METDQKDLGAKLAYAALDEVPAVKSLPDGTEDNNLGNLPSVSR